MRITDNSGMNNGDAVAGARQLNPMCLDEFTVIALYPAHRFLSAIQETTMPKVAMFFDETFYRHNGEKSFQIGREIQRLVAEAASTDEVILDPVNDVDFIPQPYPPGALASNPISFEIEAIGYPARKAKLTRETMLHLKKKIIDVLRTVNGVPPPYESALLIWLKYVDKEGLHI